MPRESSRAGWTNGEMSFTLALPTGTSASEFVTDLVPGFIWYPVKAQSIVTVAGTGAGATRDLTLVRTRSSTDTTLFSATLTLAGTTPIGTVQTWTLSTSLTDSGQMLDGDTLSIMLASGGTQFTAGTVRLHMFYRTRPQQLA